MLSTLSVGFAVREEPVVEFGVVVADGPAVVTEIGIDGEFDFRNLAVLCFPFGLVLVLGVF